MNRRTEEELIKATQECINNTPYRIAYVQGRKKRFIDTKVGGTLVSLGAVALIVGVFAAAPIGNAILFNENGTPLPTATPHPTADPNTFSEDAIRDLIDTVGHEYGVVEQLMIKQRVSEHELDKNKQFENAFKERFLKKDHRYAQASRDQRKIDAHDLYMEESRLYAQEINLKQKSLGAVTPGTDEYSKISNEIENLKKKKAVIDAWSLVLGQEIVHPLDDESKQK